VSDANVSNCNSLKELAHMYSSTIFSKTDIVNTKVQSYEVTERMFKRYFKLVNSIRIT
jgi:dGTP triphosphohydrolase